MIGIIGLYKDFAFDANKSENGEISYADFNALSWRSELRTMNWLLGNVDDANPPESISTQKQRDLLSVFIKRVAVQVQEGSIPKPSDYFYYRSLHKLIGIDIPAGECDEEDIKEVGKQPIELLDNSKFNVRCATSIKRLSPKVKPIAQLSEDSKFEFEPKDIGSTVLEYYRLPIKGEIKTQIDNVYNDEVPNTATTVNLEWPEAAREILLWFIKDNYYTKNRDITGKQFEQTQTGKPKQ